MDDKPATIPAGIILVVLAAVVFAIHHLSGWRVGAPMAAMLALVGAGCLVQGLVTRRR